MPWPDALYWAVVALALFVVVIGTWTRFVIAEEFISDFGARRRARHKIFHEQ